MISAFMEVPWDDPPLVASTLLNGAKVYGKLKDSLSKSYNHTSFQYSNEFLLQK
jgi:hypothetical protein